MIKKLLDVEGPLIGVLDKTGQLVLLSVLWILGSLPLVTVGAANAALYYAVVKSICMGQGNAFREFRKSYRENLGKGCVLTVGILGLALLLAANLMILRDQPNSLLSGGAVLGVVLLSATWMYIGPVISRFRMGTAETWKLAFVMSVRFAHYSLLLLGGMCLVIWLQICIFPIPTAVLLPGAWCFLASVPIEKALRAYMPPKEENDNAWYYET